MKCYFSSLWALCFLLFPSIVASDFKYIDHGEKLLYYCDQTQTRIKALEKQGQLYSTDGVLLSQQVQKKYRQWKDSLTRTKEDLREQGKKFQFKCR